MNETLIAAGATLLVCLINNYFQAQQAEKKHNETISLIDYKLEQLEKKQDRYNNIISRTYELEKSEKILEEKIKVVNHRVDDLEQFNMK